MRRLLANYWLSGGLLLSRLRTSLVINYCSKANNINLMADGMPIWHQPVAKADCKLKFLNSLTRRKDEFIPCNGRRVTWYSCGPTVYDAAHMGHARSYITCDILRRVLINYFHYDVFYVMNITDVDDKIIAGARRQHLLSRYQKQFNNGQLTVEKLLSDLDEAMVLFGAKCSTEKDVAKKNMLQGIIDNVEKCRSGKLVNDELFAAASMPLSQWLDKKHGAELTDHSIFSALSSRWETDFHQDMQALNVMIPDVLTRVSEYVPEVIDYVKTIVDNGFGYESNGSVYFDTVKFSQHPDHTYGKLVPEAIGDVDAINEGEGELTMAASHVKEKKSRNDFVLWKASKPGEPYWESPWGKGRPGWHIECSVMASAILGPHMDIHTGGVDLKFPHHDNEIAQAEAFSQDDQWVNYFLHSGHLTIEGCKMSKSLKNFITIKEALKQHSARQLRLAFLMHSWHATLDYSKNTMSEAIQVEKSFNEFFLTVKDLVRSNDTSSLDGYLKWTKAEFQLHTSFVEKKEAIHVALCDSVDTPTVLHHMRALVTLSNTYISDCAAPNVCLMTQIAKYLTYLLKVFGVCKQTDLIGFPVEDVAVGGDEAVLPYIEKLAEFRNKVRTIALEQKSTSILEACDKLRDETLPNLGVRLEDKAGRTVVKLVNPEELKLEMERDRQLKEEQKKKKEQQRLLAEQNKREKERKAKISPSEMFRHETDKYSKFDDDGIPTHDVDGNPLTASQFKKLKKLWQQQHEKYQKQLNKENQ